MDPELPTEPAALPAPTLPTPAPIEPTPAELHWQDDSDFAAESTFANVGAGLLLGDGLIHGTQQQGRTTRMGRNLLTEAEHSAATRAAGDLLDQAGSPKGRDKTADDIASRSPDDHAVTYLRDNADKLTKQLATKQAKAAQDLIDSYGETSKLRPSKADVSDALPDNITDQARWITHARTAVETALDGLPSGLTKGLRKQAADMGKGSDPADWFQRASELGDELAKARIAADRRPPADVTALADSQTPADPLEQTRPPSPSDQLSEAQRVIRDGLAQENLWGDAAKSETERAASYAQRVGDHLLAFEDAFTTRGKGGTRKADPTKFGAFLDSQDAFSAKALADTLASARATADAASKFGKRDDAKRILGAVDTIERATAQAKAVRAAQGRATPSPAQSPDDALSFVGGGSPLTSDPAGARESVFKAVQGFSHGAASSDRAGVHGLLSDAHGADASQDQGGDPEAPIAAPVAPGVSALNFDAVRQHITKMAQDPDYFGEVMSASFGSLPQHAPEVFSALSRQTAKVVSYLAAVAPGGTSGGPFAQTYPVGEDELWEFNQRFAAATHPDLMKHALTSGNVTSQAVEAFQQLNPVRFNRLQVETFTRLQALKKAGIPVPTQAREQLDVLLDLDGGGDPALTWKVAERAYAAQAKYAPQMREAKMGGSPGKVSSAMTSGALSTLGNGAAATAST